MHKLLIAISILIIPTFSHALTLTLEEAITASLVNNRDAISAKASTTKAQAAIIEAESFYDTLLSINGQYVSKETPTTTLTNSPFTLKTTMPSVESRLSKRLITGTDITITVSGSDTENEPTPSKLSSELYSSAKLEIAQDILKGFGSEANQTNNKQAMAMAEAAKISELITATEIARATEKIYFNLKAAHEIKGILEISVENAALFLEHTKTRAQEGLIPTSDIFEAQTSFNTKKAALAEAEGNVNALSASLLGFIGLDVHDPTTIIEPISSKLVAESTTPPKPYIEALDSALTESSKFRVAYTKNNLLPTLKLVGGIEHNYLDGEADIDSADGNSWYAGIIFSMPLENKRAKSAHISAKAEHTKNIEISKQNSKALKFAKIAAQQKVHAANTALEFSDQASSFAKASLEATETKIVEGLADTFQVIFYQDKYLSTALDKATKELNLKLAIADLKAETNTNIPMAAIRLITGE